MDEEKICDVCSTSRGSAAFPPTNLSCQHKCCLECLQSYFMERVGSGFINIACPWNGCDQTFTPACINGILKTPRWKERYNHLSLTRALLTDPETRFCPGVECEYAVLVPADIKCPVLTCEKPSCGVRFCCQCSEIWSVHHQCKDREPIPDTKLCPGCKIPVYKINNGGCNQIRCRICGMSFCWLCLQELSNMYFEHYGIKCTLYGKKQNGLKRRVFNRVAYVSEAVVGFPLAVGLVAGAVITASAVTTVAGALSSPLFLAKELVKREKARESSTKRQRLVLTGGVAMGALGMPVLAPWGIYVLYKNIYKKMWKVIDEYNEEDMREDREERERERLL